MQPRAGSYKLMQARAGTCGACGRFSVHAGTNGCVQTHAGASEHMQATVGGRHCLRARAGAYTSNARVRKAEGRMHARVVYARREHVQAIHGFHIVTQLLQLCGCVGMTSSLKAPRVGAPAKSN